MSPDQSQLLAEVIFWNGILILLAFFGGSWISKLYDCIDATPDEQAQRAQEAAHQSTSEKARTP